MKNSKPNPSQKIDDSIDEKSLMEFYWNYFELHSNQRIQMINFYITIEVVLFGSLFTLITREARISWIEYIVSSSITFMSLTFFGLDYRTKKLIHWCEDCIKQLEFLYKEKFGNDLLLISKSETKTNEHHIRFTYSKWFGMQFLVIGLFGLICLILLLNKKI